MTHIAPTPDSCAVVNTRWFDRPPDTVFAAIATPERLARWWGPAGFSNRFEHCDIREGGEWRSVLIGPNGNEYPNHSRFVEVAAPSRIVIEHFSGHHFVLSIALAPEGGGTRLIWTQRFDTAEHRDQIAEFVTQANEQNLDRLQAELAHAD